MIGHIRQRGANGHWWAVIDDRNPKTGDRVRKWVRLTDCYTRAEAQVELDKLVDAVDQKPGLRTFMVIQRGKKKPFAVFMARTMLQLFQIVEDIGYDPKDCEALELRDGEGFYTLFSEQVYTRQCWTGGKWIPVDNDWVTNAIKRNRIAKLEKQAADLGKIMKGLQRTANDKFGRHWRRAREDVVSVEEA